MKNLKIFDNFKSFSAGVQFFATDETAAYSGGKPCFGFGSVRYGEGSVYCGELYFDGKNYNKLGFGRQDFMLSEIGAMNAEKGLRKAFYIGSFDYRQTDWIYGNGVMYYVDGNNRPACFVKGFFEGVNRIAAYDGDFSYDSLADGYTPDMERDFDEWHEVLARMYSEKSKLKNFKNLFIGDSYFEFWRNTEFCGTEFYEIFDPAENLDIGVGGTRFGDWINFSGDIRDLPEPQRIFINLGFNDIHCNRTAERVFGDFVKLLDILKQRFPHAKIYLLSVVKAPSMGNFYAEEEKFNALTKASAGKLGYETIDLRAKIAAENNVFYGDGVHLNSRGYKILTAAVKQITGG